MAIHFSLFEISTAETPRKAVCLPIRRAIKDRPITFWEDIVTAIDPVRQRIICHDHGELTYQYLIIALGSVPNDFGISGLHDYALSYGTFHDALRVRERLRRLITHGQPARVVLGGGGVSGVELAGAIASRYQRQRNQLSVEIVERELTILCSYKESLRRKAERVLTCHGVALHTGMGIAKVTKGKVILTDGRHLPYDLFIWTGGLKANPVLKTGSFDLDQTGRIVVWQTLQAKGYARTYAIGDSAHFALNEDHALPQLATTALAEADHIVLNILRQIGHKSPTVYRPVHPPTYLTLGSWLGIAQFGQTVFWSQSLVRFRAWVELYFLLNYLSVGQAWRMAVASRR